MHKCEYTDKLVIENGLVTRIIHAKFDGKRYQNEMDVVKQNENNEWQCRNVLYNNFMHNYGVIFEDEKLYTSELFGIEEYAECEEIPFWSINFTTDEDRKAVTSLYPTFNTQDYESNATLIKALYFWKKNSTVFDYFHSKSMDIAYNEKLYVLSENKIREIMDFIESNNDFNYQYVSLTKIQMIMKYKKVFPKHSISSINSYLDKTDDMESRIQMLDELKTFRILESEQKEQFVTFLKKQNLRLADNSIYKITKLLKQFPQLPIEYTYNAKRYYNDDSLIIDNWNNGLKYIFKKYNVTKEEEYDKILKIFTTQEYRKDLEILLSLNLSEIALNEWYYREEQTKKENVRMFIRKNLKLCQKENPSYHTVDRIINMGFFEHPKMNIILSIAENSYRYNDKKTFNYLINHNIYMADYNHYMDLVASNNHDTSDEYWRYPNNFNEKYNYLKKQEEQKKIAMDIETNTKYMQAIQKFLKENPQKKIDGYEVFIPESIDEIRKQADYLQQCLMTCNYPNKVIDGKSLLVFLRIDGKPIATCEVNQNSKQIVQFYRDERNRANCQATVEDKNVMNKWLEKAIITEKEFNKEVA